MRVVPVILFFFFFNDTATTEIYPLPLHDALPISSCRTSRSSWKSRCGSWYDDHRPPERRAPEPCEGAPTVNQFDVVVVGTGPGGDGSAIPAGPLRLSVAAARDDPPRGPRPNSGCIPTQT